MIGIALSACPEVTSVAITCSIRATLVGSACISLISVSVIFAVSFCASNTPYWRRSAMVLRGSI
jgi:hypothetical protein